MFVLSPRQRITALGSIIVLALAAASCSGGSDPLPQTAQLAPGETYGDWGAPIPTSAAVSPATVAPATSAAKASDEDETSTTVPEALGLVDDGTNPTPEGYTRTTDLGITITGGETMFDFGSGVEPSFEARGSRNGVFTEVVVPFDATLEPDEILDTITWGRSGGIFVVAVTTNSTVTLVRLLGAQGSVDQVRPDDQGISIAAARASGLEDITIEAIDADGVVVATCADDDGFLKCS